jgi:hypothetical protein
MLFCIVIVMLGTSGISPLRASELTLKIDALELSANLTEDVGRKYRMRKVAINTEGFRPDVPFIMKVAYYGWIEPSICSFEE